MFRARVLDRNGGDGRGTRKKAFVTETPRARGARGGRTDDGTHRAGGGADDEHVRHRESRRAGTLLVFTPPARR